MVTYFCTKYFLGGLMMKNIKRLALVAMLLGSVALLLFSCKFKMNPNQEELYDTSINSLEANASRGDVSADEVKNLVESLNLTNTAIGFKIVDTKEGTPIKQGTKATELKKRFVPKKA